jgi:hypothetical protein
MKHPCIEFTRSSATFSDVDCSLGRREHLNLVTSFIDGSHIYGTKPETLKKIRGISNGGKGLMAMQTNTFLLPKDMTPKPADCLDFTHEKRCFHAGKFSSLFSSFLCYTRHSLTIKQYNNKNEIISNEIICSRR